ncbi:hypothetical protein ACJX0J_022227, partial [Zea mays]
SYTFIINKIVIYIYYILTKAPFVWMRLIGRKLLTLGEYILPIWEGYTSLADFQKHKFENIALFAERYKRILPFIPSLNRLNFRKRNKTTRENSRKDKTKYGKKATNDLYTNKGIMYIKML